MHEKIRNLSGKKSSCATGALKAENREVIMKKDKILERWVEYIGELYNSEKNGNYTFRNNFEGPPILQDEVRYSLREIKHGKTSGPDGVTIEMFDALEEYGIDLIATLINNL